MMLEIKGVRNREKYRCLLCRNSYRPEELSWPGICRSCDAVEFPHDCENQCMTPGSGLRGRYTVSFELETFSHRPIHSLLRLLNFLPTRAKSTGRREWKSPIYRDSQTLHRHLRHLFTLVSAREIDVTHIHIGAGEDTEDLKQYFRRIGKPLAAEVFKPDNHHEVLFREEIPEYADTFSPEDAAVFWINTLHPHTVEFRLVKFTSYHQALCVVHCCLDWVEAAQKDAPVTTLAEIFSKYVKEVTPYETA